MEAYKHLALLGRKVRERVTGAEGFIDCVKYDLFGCIQAAVRFYDKGTEKNTKGYYYDVSRLEVISDERLNCVLTSSGVLKSHLEILGYVVEDKVSGFTGVLCSVDIALHGAINYAVSPKYQGPHAEQDSSAWIPALNVNLISDKPVMACPNYEFGLQAEGNQGCFSISAPKK